MELPLNSAEPAVMHIDLNSCFASVEQQAHLSYRYKPLVVAAYTTPRGCVLSPSVEAKKLGIKVGMRVLEAKQICPQIIVLNPDPPKYRTVYEKLMALFQQYSNSVTPKSIDEAVLNFSQTQILFNKSLIEIAREIKNRIKTEAGDYLTVSVGIAANRFLAKTASSLHKPDGLDVITYKNLREVLGSLSLIDLCGINSGYQKRLNAEGIYTPLQFLDAPLEKLQHQVFQSINGYYWYLRLRGFEIDSVDFKRKSFGHEYALGKKTADPKELARLLMKLCEKTGRRLREAGLTGRGIHLGLLYTDHTYWHKSMTFDSQLYSTADLFAKAMFIFQQQPQLKTAAHISLSCFNLSTHCNLQLNLLNQDEERKRSLVQAVDNINDKYGEFTLTPALMMNMQDTILDRIAFGK